MTASQHVTTRLKSYGATRVSRGAQVGPRATGACVMATSWSDPLALDTHNVACPPMTAMVSLTVEGRDGGGASGKDVRFIYGCRAGTGISAASSSHNTGFSRIDEFMSFKAFNFGCPDGRVLQGWRINRDGFFGMFARVSYTCVALENMDPACAQQTTPWDTYGQLDFGFLTHNKIQCEAKSYISYMRVENENKSVRFVYGCCRGRS